MIYKRKKNETNFKRVFKVVVLGYGVCPCGWGWVRVLRRFPGQRHLPVFWLMELDLSLKGRAVSRE